MRRRRSACSVSSDSSEIDINEIAEAELGKLRRQFRIMEEARDRYCTESQDLIRRQLQEIRRLQSERCDLTRSLRVSERPLQRRHDSETTGQLGNMLLFRDTVEAQLDTEQNTLKCLKKEILRMERKLADHLRTVAPKHFGQRSMGHQMQKASCVLENKLDRANIYFNKLLAKNKQLREDLKIFHIDRRHFMQLYSRMEKELYDIHRGRSDLMDHCTSAFESRVEAQCKIVMMKEKTGKDLTQYSAEIAELKRVLAHDQHLMNFMSTKSTERTCSDEGQSHKQVLEDKHDRQLDFLEDAFHKIQRVVGEGDLGKLLSIFTETEANNFALLNYVNEQNNEIETLKGQISQIHQEMSKYTVEWQQQQKEHWTLVQRISAQQQSAQVDTQVYEQRIISVNKILDQLKTGIENLFRKIGCDRTVIEDKLGSSTGIRNDTIMIYLGLVEQRTNELLTVQSFLKSMDFDYDYNPRETAQHLLGQSPPIPLQHVMMQPPTTGEEEEFLSTGKVKPFSKEELHQQVMNKLLRRRAVYPKIKVSKTTMQHSTQTPYCKSNV